ncbi:MAG: GAF domain-containing sensor histidine kinase [Chloroflexi bacterium]|nr:GAF domain-containing sensor histidine kinase [Chloroflexota bacterium]
MSSRQETGTNSEAEKHNLRLLRWSAFILPAAFLSAVSYLGHFVWHDFIETYVGFLLWVVLLSAAALLFSTFVFKLIERAESRAFSRHRELLMLNTVAAAASQPMKLEGLLQIAVDGVVDALHLDGGVACVLDEKNQELLHVAWHGIPDEMLGPLKRMKLDEGRIHTDVVRTGEPIQVSDMSQDPRVKEGRWKKFFRSVITLPLKSEGKVKGVMALVGRSPRTFDPSEVQLLLTLGGQLAVAIERTQLHQQVASMAILEERERIAREMHDGLAQILGYINAKTSAISRLLSDNNIADALQEVVGLRDAARDLSKDIREAILGLRLASGEPGHLHDNLKEYATSFSALSGIPVELHGVEEVNGALDWAGELQVLRIIQESLTNVRKHAGATRVSLSVQRVDGEVQACIGDNGKGFDMADVGGWGQGRYGLQSMRERAESIGGTLSVDSRPGLGTRVTLAVPVLKGRA